MKIKYLQSSTQLIEMGTIKILTDYPPGIISNIIRKYEKSGKSQLSVIKIDGP